MRFESGKTLNKKILLPAAAVAALFLAMAGPARAKTATSTGINNISANVLANCQISTSPSNLAFGNYDPTSSTPLDTQGSAQISCTKGVTYWTYITGTRSFTISGDTLNFELYTDAGRSIVYPAVKTGGGSVSASKAATPVNYYGRIATGQNVGAGSGTANLVFTVEF